MVRDEIKWKFTFFLYLVLLNVFTKSLPIDKLLPRVPTIDSSFTSLLPSEETVPQNVDLVIIDTIKVDEENATAHFTQTTEFPNVNVSETSDVISSVNNSLRNPLLRQNVRPGQEARQYAIELTMNGGTSFTGRAVIDVRLESSTRDDDIIFHVENLDVKAVSVGIFTDANAVAANFTLADGLLKISPNDIATSYIVIIEYTGEINLGGHGIFQADFHDHSYMAMNLHPTHARRVFPCMDEPTEASTFTFTFNDVPYNNIVANSMLEENSLTTFRPLQGPPHLWGMVAHNFVNIIIPTTNVLLFGRSGLNQDAQASIAMNFYFNTLNEWTDKSYFEIVLNQDGRMLVFALPDTSRDWYALSTVCIWEPYIYMEPVHSIEQRKTGLVKIAEAMSRQWFGSVIYPENWSSQWVIAGLNAYSAWEVLRLFQNDPQGLDITLLDVNTLFVTEIIQESLLRDSYIIATPLDPGKDLFEEEDISDHINGLINYKAPAILRMLRLILSNDERDFVQLAGRALLNIRSLETVSTLNFYDAINSNWLSSENNLINDVMEFLEPWVESRGYPIIHVFLQQGGLLITQEHFGFTATSEVNFDIPLTYTSNSDHNYDNLHPVAMMDITVTLPMALGDEDFVLFNLQGQGYYRVNYDLKLWDRILEALNDPDQRNLIHPLNRATLLDDALNLARAGKLDYDIAFQVVLAMEHETEYAVWKAFVRNMEFLRKRLVALVSEDGDLDQDIYLRMVRRTIDAFENEIGFTPEINVNEPAMVSLTRGLVMYHACKAQYEPCIAAAVDWFFDSDSSEPTVNPDIPNDIRPAVYCTMVREGDEDVRTALYARLEIEPSHYERVVILESLACSQDAGFINTLLLETIASNSPYGVEERSKIFIAVAESSYENAGIAVNFIDMRTIEVRNMYGGPEKLENLIRKLAENMANSDLTTDFTRWVRSTQSNLDESLVVAERALSQITENLVWDNQFLEYVYDWIDENDAPKLVVSFVLVFLSFMVGLFNH